MISLYKHHAFPEGDPVGHKIIWTVKPKCQSEELLKGGIYHILNRELCLDIDEDKIGQGGLADGTGHPKHYGYVCHGGKMLPWNIRLQSFTEAQTNPEYFYL